MSAAATETKETKNSGSVASATAEKLNVMETVSQLCLKGIERLAEVQKKGIELAAEQNADWVTAVKKHVTGTLAAPGLAMLDMATAAFERSLDNQKGAIDLMVQQSNSLAGAAKERATMATKAVEDGLAQASETIEKAVAAQKTVVDSSAKQTKAAFENAKQQYPGTAVSAAADSMQRGVDVVATAQKDLLDVLKGPIQILH